MWPQCSKATPGLLLIKGDIVLPLVGGAVLIPVHQTVHHLVAQDALLDDILTVLHLYLNIQPSHGLDPQQGAHFAETVAAAFFQADAVVVGLLLQLHGTGNVPFFH